MEFSSGVGGLYRRSMKACLGEVDEQRGKRSKLAGDVLGRRSQENFLGMKI